MRPYSFDSKFVCRAIWLIGILSTAIPVTSRCELSEPTSSLQHGKLNHGELSLNYVHPRNTSNSSIQHVNPHNPPIVGPLRNNANDQEGTITSEFSDAPSVRIKTRRQDEVLSPDCFAKQNEVLKRQSHAGTNQVRSSQLVTPTPGVGFQRIQPKLENILNTAVVANVSLANNLLDGEHVPRCRPDGSYDPIQCHKIGYCWCVNKFGQAIKNSAVRAGDEPDCDPSMYVSDSNYRFVVGGISTQRIKSILKNSSSFSSTTPNGHINFEATEPTSTEAQSPNVDQDSSASQQMADASRLSSSDHGPVMPLMFNNCSGSRANARERAAKQINDSIWVPECDSENEKLYAEQQCHRARVCWCVNQSTGLPLRTSEQLSSLPQTHNCTEIKRILGLQTTGIAKKPTGSSGVVVSISNSKQQQQHQQQTHQVAFYQGSSEYCDTDKRLEFVISLNNQFRQQISEYLRQNPSSMVPTDMSSTNPYLISEFQVAKWKFRIMDENLDNKIGDREWSRFKNNFKLVDKVSELDNPFKQQKSPYYSLTPLLIVRSQRKCWRDFLEFCGNGELVDESIGLPMWMGCTEVPPKFNRDYEPARVSVSPTENTYALSREAAIVRSQKKNPFLGILKPD